MTHPRPRNVNLVLSLDFGPFLKALQRAAESINRMAASVASVGAVLGRAHEVSVSGLESRMYVRAGLDPAYATEEALDRLVRLLLRTPAKVLGLADSMFLTTADRTRLAVAAMRGWAENRPREWRHPEVTYSEPLPWFRYMAGERVYVYPDRVVFA